MPIDAGKDPWDARLTARWARQARESANDESRYERGSVREQLRSRRFWAALGVLAVAAGGAALLGNTEFVVSAALAAVLALMSPPRRRVPPTMRDQTRGERLR